MAVCVCDLVNSQSKVTFKTALEFNTILTKPTDPGILVQRLTCKARLEITKVGAPPLQNLLSGMFGGTMDTVGDRQHRLQLLYEHR